MQSVVFYSQSPFRNVKLNITNDKAPELKDNGVNGFS